MTSNAPAPARPAPTFRPPRTQPSGLKAEPGAAVRVEDIVPHAAEDELAHPAKRRKLETPPNISSPSVPPNRIETPSGSVDIDSRSKDVRRGPWRFSDAFMAATQVTNLPEDETLPALPTRPWQHKASIRATEESKPTSRVRKNIPIPTTPDKVEVPLEAPKFGKSALAGFCPWTGSHPEDVLNESNVRHGYFDRPPNPPEKEMGSARTALYGAFKHRLGLDFLSVLFGLALESKSKHGILSSTCNFKPPPRVTLTEAKRKAWLTDLANAEVPLRRLSRTIPQGIRGQSLLDQCLSHNIPISRALWFIRCVGANEIRTLKRKGPGSAVTGGLDGKWLKEWTSFVGQFLESTLQQSTQSDWKTSMQYALRLSSQLYLENLIDRDVYLDWILKGFSNADHDRSPYFLLLVQMYLPDIIRFRGRSKTLASVLVEKFHLYSKAHEEALRPLISKLRSLICSFAASRPMCFVMPEMWPQCKEVLRSCLDLSSTGQQRLFQKVESCNEKTAASTFELSKDVVTPHQAVIKLLDASKAPFSVKAIMKQCASLCKEVDLIISTTLRWVTSQYRASTHGLYLGVRLLRAWHREGQDVDKAVLDFLTDLSLHAINFESLYQLLAELSRSRTFSVSKYLQEMILQGSAQPGSFSDSSIVLRHTSRTDMTEVVLQVSNDRSQVLTELSLHQLPAHVRSLRKIMLSRTGFRPHVEVAVIHHCKRYLSQKISISSDITFQVSEGEEFTVPAWDSLSWTIKSEIAVWLRELTRTHCEGAEEPRHPLKSTVTFPQDDFYTIRDVLESMGDLAVLADVLNIATKILRDDLLGSVSETLDRHADALSAMGAFDDLQGKLCTGYLTLRSSKPPINSFVTSLLRLNERHPTKSISARLLQQDLMQGDRGSAAAACSPFSEGVAESLQQAGSHFFDDFDAILQTETNMNQETMTKLFAVLTKRIEKQNQDGEHLGDLRALCRLLARLRLFRVSQSNDLIQAWVERQIRHGEWGTTTALLVDLVGIGCLTFSILIQCLKRVTEENEKQHRRVSALATSLFTPQGHNSDAVQYRFETECMLYLEKHPIEAATILTRLHKSTQGDSAIHHILDSSIRFIALTGLPISETESQYFVEFLRSAADSILQSDATEPSELLGCKDILSRVDDFSYPLCQLSLRLQMRNVEDSSREEVGDAFFALASAVQPLEQQWSSLLPAAGSQVARHVRRRAEEAFFVSLPAFLQTRSFIPPFDTPTNSFETTSKYLDIAFAASESLTDQRTSSVTAQLIEKFALIHKAISPTSTNIGVVSPMATTTPIPGLGLTPAAPTPSLVWQDNIAAVTQYLPLLLRMTCLQRPGSTTNPTPLSKPAQQEQIKLVVLLTTLALHPSLTSTDLPSSILAVVSTFITVATFTDEMHAYCARLLKDKIRDPRVMFLFGCVTVCGSALVKDMGEGLQLHKDGVGLVGEWKQWVKNWEVIEPSGGGEGSSWVGLGMFGGRRL